MVGWNTITPEMVNKPVAIVAGRARRWQRWGLRCAMFM